MNTIVEGFQLIRLARVDSTNNFAAKLREAGSVAGPAVILAEHQSAGRGQRGASWLSDRDNSLTCTLMPDKLWKPSDSFLLNMRAVLSVCEALEVLVPHTQVQVKWPNDVMINRYKVAGILTENQVMGQQMQSIIGIGINLNHILPPTERSASIRQFSGLNHTPEQVLTGILKAWNNLDLPANVLHQTFMTRLLGTEAAEPYEDATRRFHARIRAVSPEGVLTLCEDSGVCTDYREKEVRWLGSQN